MFVLLRLRARRKGDYGGKPSGFPLFVHRPRRLPQWQPLAVQGTACLALAIASAAQVHAQSYPAKPVRFIVPYGTGGGADATARLITPRLSEYLGQTVIVDNRGGAGGNIGSELAAKAAPDGYTMLMGAAALAINASLYGKLPFDPVRDLTAVSLLATSDRKSVV